MEKNGSHLLDKRKIIIGIVIVLVLVSSIFLIMQIANPKNKEISEIDEKVISEKFVEVQADGKKVNISEKLKEEKTLDNMKVKDLKLVADGNKTTLTGVIENNTKETKGDYSIYAIAKSEEGNELRKVLGYVNNVKSGQTTNLVIKTSYDFANAYDITFEKAKKK